MNKSVLIVDTPECCDDCGICYSMSRELRFCTVLSKEIPTDIAKIGIVSGCPLKDLPNSEVANEYDFEHYSNGVSIGWNRFRNKLLEGV